MEIVKKTAYIAALAGLLLFVFLAQNFQFAFDYYKCIFHETTGLYCAGCGGTRSLLALLQGDILKALHLNALVILLLPVAFYFYIAGFIQTFFRKKLLPLPKNFLPWLWILLAATFIFMIVRNLYPFDFLRP